MNTTNYSSMKPNERLAGCRGEGPVTNSQAEAELQKWLIGNARSIRPIDDASLPAWALAALRQQGAQLLESAPVPPAGDVEVFSEDQWWLPELDAAVANGTKDQKRAVAVVRNMIAHVTRLTAERDGLMAQLGVSRTQLLVSMKRSEQLQSELTKARELLTEFPSTGWIAKRDAFLAHQSAPAAKGAECICKWDERKFCGCFRAGVCDKPKDAPAAKAGE